LRREGEQKKGGIVHPPREKVNQKNQPTKSCLPRTDPTGKREKRRHYVASLKPGRKNAAKPESSHQNGGGNEKGAHLLRKSDRSQGGKGKNGALPVRLGLRDKKVGWGGRINRVNVYSVCKCQREASALSYVPSRGKKTKKKGRKRKRDGSEEKDGGRATLARQKREGT